MVSLRRRRLLGLCSGKHSIPVQLPGSTENGINVENTNKHAKPFSVHPLPSFIFSHQKPITISEASSASANVSASTSSKEETALFSTAVTLLSIIAAFSVGKKVKRRKRHRRKHYEDQEPCIMRGVYFKNMKWQAAIKVDKKQIHLGTVGSQEEAARLYDRFPTDNKDPRMRLALLLQYQNGFWAAFMCGREPNFVLSEEDKQELRQYKWEEFLALTRNAITSKKHQRRIGVRGRPRKTELHSSDYDPEGGMGTGGSSISDDEEDEEASAS